MVVRVAYSPCRDYPIYHFIPKIPIMQKALTRLIVKTLREVADRIEAGTCELSEEEQAELLSVIAHRSLSKEEACNFVNLSRSQFDNLVRLGRLPRGRKLRGRKELIWYEDELRVCLNTK